MKVFTRGENSYESAVNFVDDELSIVGYDLAQSCCEYADWFVSDTESESIPDEILEDMHPSELWGYVFEKTFFKEVSLDEYDESKMVIFKLVNNRINEPPRYLHLFNCHNGYYSHGFEDNLTGLRREGLL